MPENRAGSAGAFYFPVETDKGRRYVIVVLDSANTMSAVFRRQARQALVYTLAVLLAMTCLTAIVVWQFTRPIKSLSIAARRVAGGDFSYRVPGTKRQDEMGELTGLFNEMTVKLGRTRELEAQLYNAEKAVVVSRLSLSFLIIPGRLNCILSQSISKRWHAMLCASSKFRRVKPELTRR